MGAIMAGMGLGSMMQDGGKPGGKKNAPKPPDMVGASEAQTKANRPDQTNAFGTTSDWTQGPDGSWTQSSNFGGPLGQANDQLQNQFASATASPLDFSGLPQIQYGEDAFNKASDSAYNQETSRLDPMWNQREEQERTRLINQGLDPSSEAAQAEMGNFNRGRNDAYQTAHNNATGLGLNAANQMFGQSMGAHNQALLELLRKRGEPLQELQGIGQLGGQSGFNSDQGLEAAGQQGQFDLNAWLGSQKAQGDVMGGVGQAAGAAASLLPLLLPLLSDERAKMNIRRLPVEAVPGVPLALYEYRARPGETCLGVIAQDLAKVLPEFVQLKDGLMWVDYRFMEVRRG